MTADNSKSRCEKKCCCQRNLLVGTVAVTLVVSLWCRKSKALCERPFALQAYRQQPEMDMQNVDLPTRGKVFEDAHASPIATGGLLRTWRPQTKLQTPRSET